MRNPPFLVPTLSILVGLTACSSDTTEVTAEGGGSESGDSGGADGGTAGDGGGGTGSAEEGTGGTTGADGSTSGDVVDEPVPARGITITEAFANQAVGVPIIQNGEWVDGAGRNAALIKGRNTLIRALYTVDPDFTPREIQAQLILTRPDGTEEIPQKKQLVEGDATFQKFDSNIYFVVPGEIIEPGMKFRFELYETGPDYENLPEVEAASFPAQSELIGIEDVDMTLRVRLVPVQHNLGPDCPDAPVIDADAAKFLEDQLYMQNPVQKVEIEVREPFEFTQPLTSFNGILQALAQLRDTDGADPSYYYYGLVRPCDGGASGVGGQAISIPQFPTLENGWTRTSMGRWYGSLSSTASTFVHEVGHTQGRRHVTCNGQEGGPDPSYPYEAGDIGVWGFGVLDFSLFNPGTSKDYMTYCGNTWVSDWTWNKIFPFIQEITSWDAAAPAPESQDILVGLIDPATGEEHWFVTQGSTRYRAANPADVFEFTAADGTTTLLPSTIEDMGDGGYNIVVPLPETMGPGDLTAVTRIQGEQRRAVSTIAMPNGTLRLAD